MMRSIVVLWVLAILACPSLGDAHQPLTTQNAYPVAVHKVQFETGLRYLNYNGGAEAFHMAIEMNYGLINNLDLGMEVPFIFYDPKPGDSVDILGDVIVKSKLLFVKGREGDPISLTFQPFIKLPTADEKKYPPPLSTGEPDFGFVLIGSRDLRPVMAHLNIGYTFVNSPTGTPYDNVFAFKIGLEYLADPTFQVMGELSGETNRVPNADDSFSIRIGSRYQWLQDISLDTGVSLGLSNASPDYETLVGITMHF